MPKWSAMPAQTPKTMPSRRFLRKACFISVLSVPERRPALLGWAAGLRSDDQSAEFRGARADSGRAPDREIERCNRGARVALERIGFELFHGVFLYFPPSGSPGEDPT